MCGGFLETIYLCLIFFFFIIFLMVHLSFKQVTIEVFVIYFEMSNLFISNTNKLFPKTLHTYIFNPLFQYLFVQCLRFFNSKHFIKKSIKCSSFLCLFTHCNCPFILFLSIHKSLKSGILLLDIISYPILDFFPDDIKTCFYKVLCYFFHLFAS